LLHNTTIHDQNKPAKHLTFMCVLNKRANKVLSKKRFMRLVLWEVRSQWHAIINALQRPIETLAYRLLPA